MGKYIHTYFSHWKKIIQSRDKVLKYQFLTKFIKSQYHTTRKNALWKWASNVQKSKRVISQVKVDKLEAENESLITTCRSLYDDVNSFMTSTKAKATMKAYKFAQKQNTEVVQVFFRRWKNKIPQLSNQKTVLENFGQAIKAYYMRVRFHHYKSQVAKDRKSEVVQVRLSFSNNATRSHMRSYVFSAWVSHTQHIKNTKILLRKILIRNLSKDKANAFYVWVKTTRKNIEHDQKTNKENVVSSVKGNYISLEKMNEHYNKIKVGSRNLESTLIIKSRHVLANSMRRL